MYSILYTVWAAVSFSCQNKAHCSDDLWPLYAGLLLFSLAKFVICLVLLIRVLCVTETVASVCSFYHNSVLSRLGHIPDVLSAGGS